MVERMSDLKNGLTFETFSKIMTCDIIGKQCIEAWFCVNGFERYHSSWLGKLIDKDTQKPVYWFGLEEDGSEAYEFETFEELVSAKVFLNKNIREIWNLLSFFSIESYNN